MYGILKDNFDLKYEILNSKKIGKQVQSNLRVKISVNIFVFNCSTKGKSD